MHGPKGAGGQTSVSVTSHMAAVSSAFLQSFLLIHPLSLVCNEGQPQWGGASSSPGPFLQLRYPGGKARGRGNDTRDSALLHTSPALNHLISTPTSGDRKALLLSPFYRQSKRNTKWPCDGSRSHTTKWKSPCNHLLGLGWAARFEERRGSPWPRTVQ